MTPRVQVLLLVFALSYYVLNVVLAVRKHFRGNGMSPGSIGASIPFLIVLFVRPWPLWLRLTLAPIVVALEFSWIGVYFFERFFPASCRAIATDEGGCRLTRRCSRTDASVAALPLPPAAERQYRWADGKS